MPGLDVTAADIFEHTPRQLGAGGRDAAIVDIAQDLLLRHLHTDDVLWQVMFKGGTSLRKLYAGARGRFSVDLDFGVLDPYADPAAVLLDILERIENLMIGPFAYDVSWHRERAHIGYTYATEPRLARTSKIDLGPSPFLAPVARMWVPVPVHRHYGQPPLPLIAAIRLEENIAEKIARLNRKTLPRDLYDLRWIMGRPDIARGLDRPLIRRLAVLKVWADKHRIATGTRDWPTVDRPEPFEPMNWLRDRSGEDVDWDDIGELADSGPTPQQLSGDVRVSFKFLADLDEEERVIAQARGQDRPIVLAAIKGLPGGHLADVTLH